MLLVSVAFYNYPLVHGNRWRCRELIAAALVGSDIYHMSALTQRRAPPGSAPAQASNRAAVPHRTHVPHRYDNPREPSAPPPVFVHGARTGTLLLGPTLLLLDFGGSTLRWLAVFGTLVAYLLHALDQSELCFIATWTAVLVQAFGHAGGAVATFGVVSARGLGLAVVSATHITLVGAWLTLHFEWLPAQHADLAALCERLLFNVLPLPVAAICTWGVGALWGAEFTPVALLVSLGAAYLLLAPPRPASFRAPALAHAHHRAASAACAPPTPTAGDPFGAVAHAACVVAAPVLYYATLHAPTLRQELFEDHARAMRTLLSASVLLLSAAPPPWRRVVRDATASADAPVLPSRAASHGSDGEDGSDHDGGYHDDDDHDDADKLRHGSASARSAVVSRRVRWVIMAVATASLAVSAVQAAEGAIADGDAPFLRLPPYPLAHAALACALATPAALALVTAVRRQPPPPAMLSALAALWLCACTSLLALPLGYLLAAIGASVSAVHAHRSCSPAAALASALCVTALTHGVLHRASTSITAAFERALAEGGGGGGGSGGGGAGNPIAYAGTPGLVWVGASMPHLTGSLVAMSGLCATAIGCSVLGTAREVRCACLLLQALLLAGVEMALAPLVDANGEVCASDTCPCP